MPFRTILLGLVSLAGFIVTAFAYAAVAGYAALFVLEFVRVSSFTSAPAVIATERVLGPSVGIVSSWLGWRWPRTGALNVTPLLLVVALIVVRAVAQSVLVRVDFAIRRAFRKPARARYAAHEDAPSHHYVLIAESERERAVLLKRYREIEDALKSAARKSCTFLSIDVVGSTKMKIDERKTAIDATFQAYEELVKHTFESYGVWKETWTPDGVMACFLDRELALTAGKEILCALHRFNGEENQLRTPLRIRCGLNEGEVAIFEDSSLEKIADHAIDVAGHMQKYASEDALQISDAIFRKLQNADGFAATGRDVDGFRTFEWKPPVPADREVSRL